MAEKKLVIIPLRARMLLIKYCEQNKIEYKLVNKKNLPLDGPQGCTSEV